MIEGDGRAFRKVIVIIAHIVMLLNMLYSIQFILVIELFYNPYLGQGIFLDRVKAAIAELY
jgi:hypothetical protein